MPKPNIEKPMIKDHSNDDHSGQQRAEKRKMGSFSSPNVPIIPDRKPEQPQEVTQQSLDTLAGSNRQP